MNKKGTSLSWIKKMKLAGYNERKAAQVVAFFAIKEGEKINVLKLTKLVYLADRAFLQKYDSPILYDKFVSMPHGPVNSLTLNFIDGYLQSADWDALIKGRSDHEVGLINTNITINDLDELSDAEIETLEATWKEYGHMKKYQIRDFTHQYCKEWNDPKGSSAPIEYETVLKFLGKENSALLAQAIEEERQLSKAWE